MEEGACNTRGTGKKLSQRTSKQRGRSCDLCDFCGIHILLMDNGLAIHMLTEKKYPLSQEMLSKMLSRKLEVDHESSQAFEQYLDAEELQVQK
ncbi:hypothetical protein Tco_0400432 [Tanacetum coccineum]